MTVRLVLDDRAGVFNAAGPREPTTLGELIHLCARVAGTSVDVIPVPEETGGPLFPLVRDRALWPGLSRSTTRAQAEGMPRTPLASTAADVLAWDLSRGEPPLAAGFTPAQEAASLG